MPFRLPMFLFAPLPCAFSQPARPRRPSLAASFFTWYDPQPHPNDPTLASTAPHHKHVPPDIKHHRIPAPGLSFGSPNLPLLIEEIERAAASR